jgi:hypothetical protein
VAVLEIALVEIAQSGDGQRPRTGAGAGGVDEQRHRRSWRQPRADQLIKFQHTYGIFFWRFLWIRTAAWPLFVAEGERGDEGGEKPRIKLCLSTLEFDIVLS